MTSRWREVLRGFEGEIHEPGDPGYDEARKVFNALIDRHPAIIAQCKGEADIQRAIDAAHKLGGPVAIRGGGHSVAGHSVCDDGIVIDLLMMRDVELCEVSSEVMAQGGARWWDVDHVTSRIGHAVPGGIISSTGIGGFTLGGGLGWLSRKHGLACDNLIGAKVVCASGRIVDVSQENEPELLWALRGGGGNFGVVSEFRFRSYPVGRVNVLICVYAQRDAAQVIRGYCAFMDSAPDEVAAMLDFCTAGESVAVPPSMRGRPVVTLLACCSTAGKEGGAALAALSGLAQPVAILQKEMRYNTWQQLLDQTAPAGRYNYWKSEFLAGMTDDALTAIVEVGEIRVSPESHLHVIRGGGAAGRATADSSAFSARGAPYLLHLISSWTAPQDTDRCIAQTRANHRRIEPYASGSAYLNFIGDEGQTRVQTSFDASTYNRLRQVKTRFDPNNLFSLNHNIPPFPSK